MIRKAYRAYVYKIIRVRGQAILDPENFGVKHNFSNFIWLVLKWQVYFGSNYFFYLSEIMLMRFAPVLSNSVVTVSRTTGGKFRNNRKIFRAKMMQFGRICFFKQRFVEYS